MIGAITLVIGAAVFFLGFIIGTAYIPVIPQKAKHTSRRKGNVYFDKEYQNLLNFNGEVTK